MHSSNRRREESVGRTMTERVRQAKREWQLEKDINMKMGVLEVERKTETWSGAEAAGKADDRTGTEKEWEVGRENALRRC